MLPAMGVASPIPNGMFMMTMPAPPITPQIGGVCMVPSPQIFASAQQPASHQPQQSAIMMSRFNSPNGAGNSIAGASIQPSQVQDHSSILNEGHCLMASL